MLLGQMSPESLATFFIKLNFNFSRGELGGYMWAILFIDLSRETSGTQMRESVPSSFFCTIFLALITTPSLSLLSVCLTCGLNLCHFHDDAAIAADYFFTQ